MCPINGLFHRRGLISPNNVSMSFLYLEMTRPRSRVVSWWGMIYKVFSKCSHYENIIENSSDYYNRYQG